VAARKNPTSQLFFNRFKKMQIFFTKIKNKIHLPARGLKGGKKLFDPLDELKDTKKRESRKERERAEDQHHKGGIPDSRSIFGV